MPRRNADSNDPYAPPTQDSPIAPGDPNLLKYQPIDQAFLERDPTAAAYARAHDMAGLNNYLHSIGRRLPVFAQEGYDYKVESGKIERTSTPWYKDPALLGAMALPVVAATPALAAWSAYGSGGGGAAAGAGTGTAALGPSTAASRAATQAVVRGSTVPASLSPAGLGPAAGGGGAAAGFATAKLVKDLWGGAADIIDAKIRSNALNNAADTQAAAAERAAQILAQAQREALDFQKQQYAQTRSDQKPWLAMGTSAVNTLGNLMGLKPADIPDIPLNSSAPVTGPVGPAASQRPVGEPTGGTAIPRPPYSVPPTTGATNALTRTYVPPTATPPSVTPTPSQAPPGPGQGRTAPAGITANTNPQVAPTGSDRTNATMVTVKWPDGTTTRIPTSQLARYVSLGAQPVGTSQQSPQQPTMGGMY